MKFQKTILLTLFFVQFLTAQKALVFDKKYIDCEDKWVSFPMSKDSIYYYGFIYIDTQAGLTFHLKGDFKIDSKGDFIANIVDSKSFTKMRLQPNNTLIALIPENRFESLKVSKIPDWLDMYRKDENSAVRLFRKGFVYNEWNACKQALGFLEKAKKADPSCKGLTTELAFSYNCLGQYSEAIKELRESLKVNPEDAYTNKELIFAQTKIGNIDEAIVSFKNAVKICKDTTYHSENAYQVLEGYFFKKDIPNFEKWLAENHDLLNKYKRFSPIIDKMSIDIKK